MVCLMGAPMDAPMGAPMDAPMDAQTTKNQYAPLSFFEAGGILQTER